MLIKKGKKRKKGKLLKKPEEWLNIGMEEQQEHELHSVRSIFAGRIFEEGLLKSVISRLHTWSAKKKKSELQSNDQVWQWEMPRGLEDI